MMAPEQRGIPRRAPGAPGERAPLLSAKPLGGDPRRARCRRGTHSTVLYRATEVGGSVHK